MRKIITVTTQAELDATIGAGNIAVCLSGYFSVSSDNATVRASDNATVTAYGNATVEASDNATVRAYGNATVEASDNATVTAYGNATVEASDNATVTAYGNATVEASDNATVRAYDNATVRAYDNATVTASGNATVTAYGNATVTAYDNATVTASGNATVTAYGNVFIRLFSALKITATAHVVILRHGPARESVGGLNLDAAGEPKTGREWAELNGVDMDAPYRVENIDRRVLDIIGQSKGLNMTSWHGTDKCDADNWCGTTHCRAGAAICAAGQVGFDLEKKYGAERAGRMIYAVSRPDEALPNFFATTDAALADIKASAERSAVK
jgi:hypothetical protein